MSGKFDAKTCLQLETLEDRCLMTASPSPTVLTPVQKFQQPSSAMVQATPSAINVLGLDGNAAGPLVRSYDMVSGMRLNHNETMVRDAARITRMTR